MTRQQELGLKEGQVPFEGDYLQKMFELRLAGLTPWSTEDVMDARNKVGINHPLWNNYFDTDFGIAGTKNRVYVIPHSKNLRSVTAGMKLTAGGLPLEVDASVKVYNHKDMILDRNLDEDEARKHPLWSAFAGGNQDQLNQYVEKAFRFGKDKYDYNQTMGIFVPVDKEPIERAVVLSGLDDGSRAYGLDHLSSNTRFVGVRRSANEVSIAPQAHEKKSSPFREDPRSDLEIFLSQHNLSEDELLKAVELYNAAKELKI